MEAIDIDKIEQALSIKLYAWQIEYLQGNEKVNIPSERRQGKTLAYCIKLALSKGEPIRLNEVWMHSDVGQRYGSHYSKGFFTHLFIDTLEQLKGDGLIVREIIFSSKR